MKNLHLAQFNIGRMLGPLEGPVMRGILEWLDEINALAGDAIAWLHIARVVGEEAKSRGFRRVGILGTRYTMGGGASIYRDALNALEIETIVPDAADAETVHRILFAELPDGVFTDASRQIYNRVIARLAAATRWPWPARRSRSSCVPRRRPCRRSTPRVCSLGGPA